MDIDKLEIIEVDETPPPLDLMLQETETLADELVEYHAAYLSHRKRTVERLDGLW